MYELIILALLMRFPMHGYLIAKVTNDQIGPWAKLSTGTLYTILGRLEEDGLIAAVPESHVEPEQRVDPVPRPRRGRGRRQARTFALTDLGRKQFHQSMMDTSSNLGDYQRIFQLKYIYLDLLTPEERLLLLNHYVNYCQTTILHMRTEMGNLSHELTQAPNQGYLRRILEVMRHVLRQWEAERDWAEALMRAENFPDGTPPTSSHEERSDTIIGPHGGHFEPEGDT